MKQVFVGLLLVLTAPVYAQGGKDSTATDTVKVFTLAFIEQMPEYPGGQPAMVKFLQENVRYPAEAQKLGISGRVYVGFIIDTQGRITKAEIVKSDNLLLNDEALRVIRRMPRWKPGRQKGAPVNVRYVMPLKFG